MDAMERWFVLLAAAGLLGFGATVAWVLAQPPQRRQRLKRGRADRLHLDIFP